MRITALAGGIGAAKFLTGLVHVVPAQDITIISNTGDDIELCGLRICPDIDTLLYTLGGLVNTNTGWGIEGDTFECLTSMSRFDLPTWFKLGDRDLATHIYRTTELRSGRSLSKVTDSMRNALKVQSTVLPMADSYCPTRVLTDEGEMHFQEYFVGRLCKPRVIEIRLDAATTAEPAPGVREAINGSDAVLICPSNPFISIGPILAVPGIREELRNTKAKVIAISPIIGGRALKGPAADMLKDLGHQVSTLGVARIYSDFLDCFVLDRVDIALEQDIQRLGIRPIVSDTVMTNIESKVRLADEVMAASFQNG